jgi:glyceraldehyde 3-phosphate dehydrogenase
MKVIDELCGIKPTSLPFIPTDQSLHDQPHKDLRRARGSIYCSNYYRSSEGINKIFPTLDGKIGGCVFVSLLLMVR